MNFDTALAAIDLGDAVVGKARERVSVRDASGHDVALHRVQLLGLALH